MDAVERQQAPGVAELIKPAAVVAASAGRIDLIEKWLTHIPADWIERDPQLLYWSGATLLLKRPLQAQPFFERAFEQFGSRGKKTWMLLAWAGVVDSIFLHYRDLRELDPWIEWMTPEREAAVDKLPQLLRSQVVASMLFALVFRQPHHPRIIAWRGRAERMVEVDSVSDLGARLVSGLFVDYAWRGDLAAAEISQKRFHAHASRTPLTPMATILGHLIDATLFLPQGKLEECIKAVERGLEASAKHNIRLWESILHCHAVVALCSRNEHLQARHHLDAFEQLFSAGVPVDEAYYRTMLFWTAFVNGDHIGTVSRCASALEAADVKGVAYFQAACRIGSGLTLFESGHREYGEKLLQDGLCIGREIDNPLLMWIGGLFQAHMAYACGDHSAGGAALDSAMRLGRDHSFAHFFCWPQKIITQLIDKALARNYSVDYAQRLISIHGIAAGKHPTYSDAWAFDVRIYTFGNPRIEYADGRIEHLSVQFQRQIELLAALISKSGKLTPLHAIASDVYQDDDVDSIGSIKRVLHSLRQRFGHIVVQRNAALALDFSKVWIDACSLQQQFREAENGREIEVWLYRYYCGHFMDCVENSENVLGLRRRYCSQVESALRRARDSHIAGDEQDALRKFEARWNDLFPNLCL